jgi:preprotein translocase subunit SecG
MDLFVNILHVVLCILLILVIILQPSKGSDIGAAFGGGGGSSTMFGPRGPGSVLSRATTVIAVLFMVTSISLAMRSVPKGGAGTALSDDAAFEGLDNIDLGLDDLDLGLDFGEAESTESTTLEAAGAEAAAREEAANGILGYIPDDNGELGTTGFDDGNGLGAPGGIGEAPVEEAAPKAPKEAPSEAVE